MYKTGGDMTYLEVVDDTLAVEEVVCDGEEVPVQSLAPWIPASHVLFADVLPLQGEERSDLTIHQGLA